MSILPGIAVNHLLAVVPRVQRASRWLAALCMVASSAGCILTQDIPDPALDIPGGYKAADRPARTRRRRWIGGADSVRRS